MDSSGVLFLLLSVILVIALSYLLDHLWVAVTPFWTLYLLIRFPGVVLHESAHIIGCLVTGARIRKVVWFSRDGGSVTYSRPFLPYIGDVVISTAPIFVLPLVLSVITWLFGTYLGCSFPAFTAILGSPEILTALGNTVFSIFSDNLAARFNGWFLLYLYLTLSIVLSIAPSRQDMKNAAFGTILLLFAGFLLAVSGIPMVVSFLYELVRLLGYGFALALIYGLVALTVSLPVLAWYAFRSRS